MEARTAMEDPLRLWAGAAGALLIGVIAATLAFPARVYDGFIWRYLWGPVVADAHGVSTSGCAVREGGEVTIHGAQECAQATGIVAHPGYTTVSTVTYALILLFAIIGVVLLMDRLDIGSDRSLFYALVPFVVLGGALRVVEDANALLFRETGEMLIGLPWVGLLISPFIYFMIFAIAAVGLLACLYLEARGVIDRYDIPFAAIGVVALLMTFGILGYFHATTDMMDINVLVGIISLGGATLITAVVWVATQRYWPEVNAGTGFMGAIVIWGHAVDGIANVLSLDWADAIGLPRSYEPKHVANEGIRTITASIQPEWLTELIGPTWPFLPVKVLVAVVVVWVFNDEVFEESPNFAMLMLVAIFAVGLGPGTRDFLRAMLGI